MNKNRILVTLMICALAFTLCACVGKSNVTSIEAAKSKNAANQEKSTFERTSPTEATKPVRSIPEHGSATQWKTISAGSEHTIGIKCDGSVAATGENRNGQCEVSDWHDIVAVSAGYLHTIGLMADGTVVSEGGNYNGQCDVRNWRDIVAISAGKYHTVGLKSDGTVVAVGDNY